MDAPDKDKDQADQEDKGFAVHDKRRIGKEDAPEAGYTAPETPAEQPAGTGARPSGSADGRTAPPGATDRASGGARAEADQRPYMPLTFTSFVMSLSTSALIYLGQVPDPVSGKTITDLVGARQTIDLISLLKEKTAGNLTPDEVAFIDGALYDLRMLFVKANS
jgi:hypothetical protein